MAILVAVIVTLFSTAFGKPQYLVSTNGVIAPHYYQQPLTYLYPGMTHQTYFHANPFLVPYTYPVNLATSSVVQTPKVQPYWFLSHCEKLQDKATELFNLADANLDGKVTLAEIRDDTDDPRVTAIWMDIFASIKTEIYEDLSSITDVNYLEALERPLFAKNDVNKDNSLNVVEFSNFIGDTFDVVIYFQPYDANQDYYLDKTEFEKSYKHNMEYAEIIAGDMQGICNGPNDCIKDGKLSVVDTLSFVSFLNNNGGLEDSGADICARKKVAG